MQNIRKRRTNGDEQEWILHVDEEEDSSAKASIVEKN
jgi:hypothetical protein